MDEGFPHFLYPCYLSLQSSSFLLGLFWPFCNFYFPRGRRKRGRQKSGVRRGGGNTGVWGEVSPVGRLARKGKKKKVGFFTARQTPKFARRGNRPTPFFAFAPVYGKSKRRTDGLQSISPLPPVANSLFPRTYVYTVVQFALPPFPQSCHLPSFLFPKCIHWKGFFACRCLEPVSDKPLSYLQNVHKANTQK